MTLIGGAAAWPLAACVQVGVMKRAAGKRVYQDFTG
jgi:hypothetical protein